MTAQKFPMLQSHIPYDTSDRGLPGVQPLDMSEWLYADDAYEGQLSERERLLKEHKSAVLARSGQSHLIEEELWELALANAPFIKPATKLFKRPDGNFFAPSGDRLRDLGLLFQEDFCLLEKRGKEHVLIAAVLCFPAHWTLREKIGKPLKRIHKPVKEYNGGIAKRVQRLFDGVQVDKPLWRYNLLEYHSPKLHHPGLEGDRRKSPIGKAPYLRSERQSIVRLPKTGAIVFSIHTSVIRNLAE